MTSVRFLARRLLPFLLASMLFAIGTAANAAQSKSPQSQPHSHYPDLPSEMPAHFKPVTRNLSYTRRIVQIPMRDGSVWVPSDKHPAGIVLL